MIPSLEPLELCRIIEFLLCQLPVLFPSQNLRHRTLVLTAAKVERQVAAFRFWSGFESRQRNFLPLAAPNDSPWRREDMERRTIDLGRDRLHHLASHQLPLITSPISTTAASGTESIVWALEILDF